MLKNLKTGQAVELKDLSKNEHKTQPPPRFSETKLISELEKRGIGRPATFSSIVSVIQERGYVRKIKGQQLAPTFLGIAVVKLLMEKFPDFTNYEYTASMEAELEKIESGTLDRSKFLSSFWSGTKGFDALVKDLSSNIQWDEIRELMTFDLHNGYSVNYSKFGVYLQDNNGELNAKGYLPSVKIDEDALAEDFLDPEVCKELFVNATNRVEARSLGVLESGMYAGWTLWVRDGKFGFFVQALSPERVKAQEEGKKPPTIAPKPINHKIPEGLDPETLELNDVKGLFDEVKLPRWSPDGKMLIGIGKKGAYLGKKRTVKAKPTFKSLPDKYDPRTMSFDEAKKVWDEDDAKK